MLLQATTQDVDARFVSRGRTRSARITLRRRLHVSSLITDPGTVEAEWGTAWTESESLTMPTTLKYTPCGYDLLWGRTEYSASFDSLSSAVDTGYRVTHPSDHLSFTATSLVLDGEHWNLAVAPSVSFGFRDQPGLRAGMTAITRYDFKRSSAGATATWSGTTNPNDASPAGTLDIGSGYGYVIGEKTTVHGDVQFERSTGFQAEWSFFEGVEYQFTPTVALDVSAQHLNAIGGTLDHQVLIGLTINFGSPSTWFRRR